MVFEFKLPDLGEGIQEAHVREWKVTPGQAVAAFQPLCEVESAKASMELTSPVAGRLVERCFAEGETALLGEVLAVIDTGPAATTPRDDVYAPPAAETGEWFGIVGTPPQKAREPVEPRRVLAAPFVRRLARERGVRLEDIAGTGPQGRVRAADIEAAPDIRTPAASATPALAAPNVAMPARPPTTAPAAPGITSTAGSDTPAPAAPSLAMPATSPTAAPAAPGITSTAGSDTTTPAASDITVQASSDTEACAVSDSNAPVATDTTAPPAPETHLSPGPGAGARTIPLIGLRKSIADHMVQAWRAPQVTAMDLLDATELVRARDLLRASPALDGARLTYLPFFVRAAVEALKVVPEANATIDEQQQAIVLASVYHIGIATTVPGGLVVPVLRHADRLTLIEIAAEVERLVANARARRSPPAELTGSTFTITSFGSLPGSPLFATPILNSPEVAILGLGRIDAQPRVVDGTVVARQCVGASFTFDHRVMDGEAAGRFMTALKRYVEQPLELLLTLR